jgi:hypothetical protein
VIVKAAKLELVYEIVRGVLISTGLSLSRQSSLRCNYNKALISTPRYKSRPLTMLVERLAEICYKTESSSIGKYPGSKERWRDI